MVPLLLAALIASPAPAPTPVLKTIVTVKSSPFCGSFAAHVNSAIGSAVDNDQMLGSVIVDLRSGDLGRSTISRSNSLQRLSALSTSIYKQFRAGEAEVSRLRELASKTADPQERVEVEASADALGGALYRQHLVQRDLDGFVAFLYARQMASSDDSDWDPHSELGPGNSLAQLSDPTTYWIPGGNRMPTSLTLSPGEQDARMAASAAGDFQDRLPAILEDEMNAGGHIEAAGDRC